MEATHCRMAAEPGFRGSRDSNPGTSLQTVKKREESRRSAEREKMRMRMGRLRRGDEDKRDCTLTPQHRIWRLERQAGNQLLQLSHHLSLMLSHPPRLRPSRSPFSSLLPSFPLPGTHNLSPFLSLSRSLVSHSSTNSQFPRSRSPSPSSTPSRASLCPLNLPSRQTPSTAPPPLLPRSTSTPSSRGKIPFRCTLPLRPLSPPPSLPRSLPFVLRASCQRRG
mmetsp:Transcript_12868/g.30338  ORF Transcript_12868/g.30338 Transcript_12868/m.30338 type:complete len:222 (+) Transcript_12868:320-985(+)